MFRRFIQKKLRAALEFMPGVLLRGGRQTGKTTFVKELKSNYITFDHVPSFVQAKEDPIGFLSTLTKPVIIDEVQRMPEIFLPIKQDVDENRLPGRYLLTGSADPLLIPQLGDSLAGRMRLLTLFPLSQGEIMGKEETFLDKAFRNERPEIGGRVECSKEILFHMVVKGGYPGPFFFKNDSQRRAWFDDYVSLVLQKDILELSKVENIVQIPELMVLLATRLGGLLNVEEISRTSRLSVTTLHRHLALLRTLFLVHLVPSWSGNLSKRVVKSPKLYLADTALALYLLNIDEQRLRQDPRLFGSLLENFVILELMKQISWSELTIHLYHFRDYQHSEVDVVLEGPGGDLVAIEIKSSETISKDDFKGLKAFQETAGEKFLQGILLYAGNTHLSFGENLIASPIATLWE